MSHFSENPMSEKVANSTQNGHFNVKLAKSPEKGEFRRKSKIMDFAFFPAGFFICPGGSRNRHLMRQTTSKHVLQKAQKRKLEQNMSTPNPNSVQKQSKPPTDRVRPNPGFGLLVWVLGFKCFGLFMFFCKICYIYGLYGVQTLPATYVIRKMPILSNISQKKLLKK